MEVFGAVGAAITPIVRTRVRIAGRGTGIDAIAEAVAGIFKVQGVTDAELLVADGTGQVDAAGPGAVAGAILVTLGGAFVEAVIARVSSGRCRATGTGAIARFAEGTVVIRVQPEANGTTGPEGTGHGTRFTQSVTESITAVAIDAEVRDALVAATASFTIGLLWLALAATVAEVISDALGIVRTRIGAGGAHGIAEIGRTGLRAVVLATTDTVASVGKVDGAIGTALRTANSAG